MLRERQKLTAVFFTFLLHKLCRILTTTVFLALQFACRKCQHESVWTWPKLPRRKKFRQNLRFRILDGRIANSSLSEFHQYGILNKKRIMRIYYLHRDTAHNLNCRPQRHATKFGPKSCFPSWFPNSEFLNFAVKGTSFLPENVVLKRTQMLLTK